jgi:hypothetical protein
MAPMLNRAWHQQHVMPKRPSVEQRLRWHVAHARACGCREIPRTIVAELRRRGRAVPQRKS